MAREGASTGSDNDAPAAHSECRYTPELPGAKLRWLLFGAVLGAILGFLASSLQVHLENKSAQQKKMKHWIAAVKEEIDWNSQWGTDTPAFHVKGDSVPLKSFLRFSALQSFLDLVPDLLLEKEEIVTNGRHLLDYIHTVNQIVEIRNLLKNEQVRGSKGSLEMLEKARDSDVEFYDRALNERLQTVDDMAGEYGKLLTQISEGL